MIIYYIKYRDDNVDEDGLWLFPKQDIPNQFFVSLDDAVVECDHKNEERRNQWLASCDKTRLDWESKERAFKALEGVEGFDARKLFPYHKREWTQVEPQPTYIIEQLEVKDPEPKGVVGCNCKGSCELYE